MVKCARPLTGGTKADAAVVMRSGPRDGSCSVAVDWAGVCVSRVQSAAGGIVEVGALLVSRQQSQRADCAEQRSFMFCQPRDESVPPE